MFLQQLRCPGRRHLLISFQHHFTKQKYVSTWSPLATAFNTKHKERLQLNILRENAGLLCVPQLKDCHGFYLLQENVHNAVESLISEACGTNRTRKMVTIFDEMSDTICRVADVADFFRFNHPSAPYKKAAEDCMISLSGLIERLNTHVELFCALRKVQETGDIVKTDSIDQRVGDLFLFDFLQSGIHLDQHKRERVVELNNNIIHLGNFFLQGIHKPVEIPIKNFKPSLLAAFSDCRAGDQITLRSPMVEHPNEMMRELSYKMYYTPIEDQDKMLQQLLLSRNELANLVGYETYAHKALKTSLGKTPENVMDYLTKLAESLKPRVESDKDIILSMNPGKKDIAAWDFHYFSTLAKRNRYDIDNLKYAQYLSLGACMDGLNQIFQCLYNVTLEPEKPQLGELWSNDVNKLAVVHATEGVLGYIYCDFFQRYGKPEQDCHYTLRGGKLLDDGTYQLPIIVLMLNYRPPLTSVPTLLTPGMMENLFHEFGHAMHSMLGRTRYQHITGTRCHTDFAEVPSILMEYFASDPRVLAKFARHHKTGEVLPEKMIHQLCQSKKMFAASEKQTTVFYSIVDQLFHGKHPLSQSTSDILATAQNTHHSIPYVPNTAWHLRFGHFVNYGAKYYAYSMAKAVASRIWYKCFKDDPFNRAMGEKYRHEVLAHGGGKSPDSLIQAMLDEEINTDKLVQSVIDELSDINS